MFVKAQIKVVIKTIPIEGAGYSVKLNKIALQIFLQPIIRTNYGNNLINE